MVINGATIPLVTSSFPAGTALSKADVATLLVAQVIQTFQHTQIVVTLLLYITHRAMLIQTSDRQWYSKQRFTNYSRHIYASNY